jgi:hypothetical protein
MEITNIEDSFEQEIQHILVNARKFDVSDSYFHVDINHGCINFESSQKKLEDLITEFMNDGEIKRIRLGAKSTSAFLISKNRHDDRITAFWKNTPCFGRCVICEIWNEGVPFTPKFVNGVSTLSAAMAAFSKLKIPNLYNKVITVSPV